MDAYQEFAKSLAVLGLERKSSDFPLPQLNTDVSDELEHYADLLKTYKDPNHIHCVFFKLGQPPEVLEKCKYLENLMKIKGIFDG